jgi:hypothetical protein
MRPRNDAAASATSTPMVVLEEPVVMMVQIPASNVQLLPKQTKAAYLLVAFGLHVTTALCETKRRLLLLVFSDSAMV